MAQKQPKHKPNSFFVFAYPGERTLCWEEVMQFFRDSTGLPGPATWRFGNYPRGCDDYPVDGVSWFEAAAYAEFAREAVANDLSLAACRSGFIEDPFGYGPMA